MAEGCSELPVARQTEEYQRVRQDIQRGKRHTLEDNAKIFRRMVNQVKEMVIQGVIGRK